MKQNPHIEMIDTPALIPYINNSRTHSPEQILAASWKLVEGKYAVSDSGLIISIARKCKTKSGSYRTLNGGVLTQYRDKDGYLLATCRGLSKNGQVRVHRLVALCFIGNPEEGKEINHIDGDKTNNAASNLEYVTSKENSIHAVNIGLIGTGIKHHNTKPVQIEKEGFGFVAFGVRQIIKTGLRHQSVHRAARGERKSINGWVCCYV